MLSWIKSWFRNHFGFSSAEVNGTLVLLLLTTAWLLVPQGLKWYYRLRPAPSHAQDIALLEHTLALLAAQEQRPGHVHKASKKNFRQSHSLQSFDINTADEVQLSTIKGIGPVLSVRIVKFRNQLGGFVSQAQYGEVYGIRPEVVERLKKHTYIGTNFQPKKIDINTADTRTFAAHPYITYRQARSITSYRTQHGPFLTVEALNYLTLIEQVTLNKLKPYLSMSQ